MVRRKKNIPVVVFTAMFDTYDGVVRLVITEDPWGNYEGSIMEEKSWIDSVQSKTLIGAIILGVEKLYREYAVITRHV